MTVSNWKRIQPDNIRQAMRLCKDYAFARDKRLSMGRLADLLAVSEDTLYKWLQRGTMPASVIPAYELICGINYVSRWLAASSGQMVIDMPKGKPTGADDLVQINSGFSQALQLLSSFYAAPQLKDPAEVAAALRTHMEAVAYHHSNVTSYATPQLEFGE